MTKEMLAMKLAQNDLEARNQFNGFPADKFDYIVKYICKHFNKSMLEIFVEIMESKNSKYERMGYLCRHYDMEIVPGSLVKMLKEVK